ncbi:HD-GYP domain-containing protein [Rheinheimera mesophila]|uniref:HD-GYP domain-containing protein n=2 Tax=Rheinheimera mesophila TaxID=1547515 RepID=A0A3P3QKJ7_9GAMM|nr:HD-GYP domain-containing protein [Rheinheimera mesophila]KKL01125.1 HD family phosphohydrolase [Rheinheimera mesophila]RRJ20969.1 HD-GYP domain-containing protein [Rheinheimera mesophila]
MPVKIAPKDIKLGYAIKLPVGWMKHPFLTNKLIVESAQQLRIIQSLELEYVYFYPERSAVVIDTSADTTDCTVTQDLADVQRRTEMQLDKEQRIEQAKAHRRELQKTEKAFAQSMAQVRHLMSKVQGRPLNAIEDATQLISQLADTILSEDALVLHLISQAGKEQESMYFHVLNVSILAMMLAKNLNCSADEVRWVGLGAMFHDIGKLKIPSQILRKTTGLTNPEQNFIKLHPKLGLELLALTQHFPAEAKAIVEQHHEYLDGSGYPAALNADAIHKLARIVAVVNEFDNLCHPQDMSQARSPHHALSVMYKTMKGKLGDLEMKMMIKMMGIYPPGTVVLLSDQRVGIVMAVNSDSMLYPDVLIYDADVPRLEAAIVTLEANKLSIEKVIKPKALPPEVFAYLNPRAQVSYFVQQKN